MVRAVFISDIHLIDSHSSRSQIVLRFLGKVAPQYDALFILGDLFDSWPATTPYLVRRFQPLLSKLKELVSGGIEVHYFEGNHDFHLGEYFSQLGVRVYRDQVIQQFGDKQVLIAHGDLGNPGERGYRLLRKLLRSAPAHWAFRTIPHSLVFGAGRFASQLSRRLTGARRVDLDAIRKVYREQAVKHFKEGCDVVLMGHTHIPDNFAHSVKGRDCQYLNTGDWLTHFTYVEFDGSQFYTREHPVKDLTL